MRPVETVPGLLQPDPRRSPGASLHFASVRAESPDSRDPAPTETGLHVRYEVTSLMNASEHLFGAANLHIYCRCKC